jgi:hypothetical protein
MDTPLNTDMPPDVNAIIITDQNLDTNKLPSAIETNTPEKKESSAHLLELFATIYFLVSIAGGVYNLVRYTGDGQNAWPYVIWGQGYLVYLIMAICCNKTRKYLENMTSRAEYETVYYDIKKTSAYFVFSV